MKNRSQRRTAARIAKLDADLADVHIQETNLRQDLETAKAKKERLQAKDNARVEASLRTQLVEAAEQVSRAREAADQLRVATEKAETKTRYAIHIPPSPPRAVLTPICMKS